MWCHRLSHLQSRLQDLLRGRVTRWALQQSNFKSLFPLAIYWHHTASKSLNCVWQQHEDHFELQYANNVMRFDYVWLRDHCRSASCYNSKTHQRSLDTASVDLCIQPQTIHLDETTLFFTWPDAHVPAVDFQTFLETKEGLKNFLQNFLLYGIAFVENVPPTQKHTEKLAERISLISWHTDTTYFQEPCGIQVFHCLKHEGTGGRTLLVDGFYAAEQVLQKAPEEFELLSKVPLKHEYIENVGECQNHMIGVGPVLNIYPWNKELYLIRYNNYDRAVINTVPYDVVHRWYTAHRTLTRELRRPENEFWVKLKPGKVLFIDNWRVLHGRESFTGYRQLCGCYLTRDDVLNTARLLGLQA
nr:PREDICTED: trimethyllysine dioxygenase, mitochondrial [Bos indicus]